MSNARRDRRYRSTTAGTLAYQLGWFSIALGAVELFAARQVARTLGMHGQERLIRAYGVREIAKGVGILTSPNPTPWLRGRVAGDALDLDARRAHPNSPRRGSGRRRSDPARHADAGGAAPVPRLRPGIRGLVTATC